MLVGDRLQESPVEGEVDLDRLTVPVKPFTVATVTVEVPVLPLLIETAVGLVLMLKSGLEEDW